MNVKALKGAVLLILATLFAAVLVSYSESVETSQPIKEDVYCLTKICVIHNDMTECISTGGRLSNIRVERDDLITDQVTLQVIPSNKLCK